MNLQQVELVVSGYRDEPLAHTYLQHLTPTPSLGVVLPGMGYGIQAPGLLYPTHALTELGFDTFALETRYATPLYQALSDHEALVWLMADVRGAYHAAWTARPYERLCVVAKSLGTLGLCLLLDTESVPARTPLIWLTPLLKRPEVMQQIIDHARQSLVVIGTDDPHYLPNRVELLSPAGVEMLVLNRTDHSFEGVDDTAASLKNLVKLVERLKRFVTRHQQVTGEA